LIKKSRFLIISKNISFIIPVEVYSLLKKYITTFITEKVHIMELSKFVKQKRTSAKLTQPELAEKAGVGLRFLRELEQGKESLRLDKVNQVLKLFGYKAGAVQLIVEEDEKG
jgi:y4mF family transcriptional regulator